MTPRHHPADERSWQVDTTTSSVVDSRPMRIVDQLSAHPSFGSFASIAKLVGQSREAVRNWKTVPAEFCIKIERHTGGDFTRYQMRPDVFEDDPAQKKDAA